MADIARYLRVTGLVQGVGFRPCVYRIALALNLKGEVFNDAQGVGIYLEGVPGSVLSFEDELRKNAPPLSRIDSVQSTAIDVKGYTVFSITPSRGGAVSTAITPDAAVCEACLADMFTPGNRRYRYPFTNCTHCGPRYTITRALPYDRSQTSMATFVMCDVCAAEYKDPVDRRFHAQPNACPVCGPKVTLTDAKGQAEVGDAIDRAAQLLREGKIIAIKGLGGFHLACDARNKDAVARLRERKHRDEKPFALMLLNPASANELVYLDASDEAVLTGVEHPILLLPKKKEVALPGIADDLVDIGVMLPYTPLHWCLFHSLAGKPEGVAWTREMVFPMALVMTSANPSGEPLVTANEEAYERLGDIADYFLLHNRDILIGCDDSVVRRVAGELTFVRRARGYTPKAVKLKETVPNAVATGPFLKNTAAVSRGNEVFLSQHIGELQNTATQGALKDAIEHLLSILEVQPDLVACDAHPDFYSTHLAQSMAKEKGLSFYPIYHHAAHIGAAMAELGRKEVTLGLALDGVGLGPNEGIWGGEVLLCDATGFSRKAHLTELPLVGGDKAAREPWRMGAALLLSLGRQGEIAERYRSEANSVFYAQVARNTRLTKVTSSLGRYFDGVASLLGLCDVQRDEAHAAMLLEALASTREGRVIEGWKVKDGVIDILGSLLAILADSDRAQAAADFHRTVARALAAGVLSVVKKTAYTGPVVLTGGCVINRLLSQALQDDLKSEGIESYIPRQVPPGDGGVALGELYLATLCAQAGASAYVFRNEDSCV